MEFTNPACILMAPKTGLPARIGGSLHKVTVEINTGVVQGRFPRRALKSLLEWYELYREQLLEDWQLAEQHQPLLRIPPLE
jgi:hypothetical protein